MRDLRCPDRRLQIVVRLRSSAASLKHVGQRRQSELKTCFGCFLVSLRILQVGFRHILLPFGVEHVIIRRHHLEDNLAVGVIEEEISAQQIGPAGGDLLRAPAEVEDDVVHF